MAADPAKVARAKALLDKYGLWINRYRGGMPAGWLAAIMMHESDGNPGAPGDASLGEAGLYQIAADVPKQFGYPAAARLTSENNVAIAVLEYSLEAVKWFLRYPNLVKLGTADSWKLARLSFAVGRSGSYQLADGAKTYLEPGRVYDGILRYVAAFGAPQLGSQSPSKVAARVADIPVSWEIGAAVDGTTPGPPTRIPDPPAGPYKIPADIAAHFIKPIPGILLALAAGAGLLLYFMRR